MKTTTLFRNGGSQAVRIPKEMRLEGNEVFIKQVPEGLLLIPKQRHVDDVWNDWIAALAQYDEVLTVDRGGEPQTREDLDAIFP